MNFDGIPVPPFHTYGFNLARDRAFDKVLRNVLLRCLADIPTDRPSLEELLDWVQWKERSWDDAAHARARAFTQSIFNEPPSVSFGSNLWKNPFSWTDADYPLYL